MEFQFDIKKLESNKSKFDKEWYAIAIKMIQHTANRLCVVSKEGNFFLVAKDKNSPIIIRVPFTLQLNQSVNIKSIQELLNQNIGESNGIRAYDIIIKSIGNQPADLFFNIKNDVVKFNKQFKNKKYQNIWNMLNNIKNINNQKINTISDLRNYIQKYSKFHVTY